MTLEAPPLTFQHPPSTPQGEFKTDSETGQVYQEVTGIENNQTVTLEISTQITIEES